MARKVLYGKGSRHRSDRNERLDRAVGAASVEFALLTTAIAAATAGIIALLQTAAGSDFSALMDSLAQLVTS